MNKKADQMAKDQKIIQKSRKMSDLEFLESMSQSDSLIDHNPPTTCGQCANQYIMAQTARDMLALGEIEDAVSRWAEESRRRWEASKYFKLWREASKEGRDPHEVFAEKGWEP